MVTISDLIVRLKITKSLALLENFNLLVIAVHLKYKAIKLIPHIKYSISGEAEVIDV